MDREIFMFVLLLVFGWKRRIVRRGEREMEGDCWIFGVWLSFCMVELCFALLVVCVLVCLVFRSGCSGFGGCQSRDEP